MSNFKPGDVVRSGEKGGFALFLNNKQFIWILSSAPFSYYGKKESRVVMEPQCIITDTGATPFEFLFNIASIIIDIYKLDAIFKTNSVITKDNLMIK